MQKGWIFLKTQYQLVVQFNEQSVYHIQGRGLPPPPYFWTKLRPEGTKKNFLRLPLPTYLRVWITGPPPYLKVRMNCQK